MSMKGSTVYDVKATADRYFFFSICEWSLSHGRLEERTS